MSSELFCTGALYKQMLHFVGGLVIDVDRDLGHKSATENLDIYGHLWPHSDEQTRNILNESVGGAAPGIQNPDVLERGKSSCVFFAYSSSRWFPG